ncbi:hypothetical protein AMS68_003723 [Peltaster fructicola]|uniref:non-specific serine/threonine protein kinase n=1 Tax=Peltaster fructicola TaxID=286661 RepID=A0A6H0XU49_9PEZI|nr:hypothetical protein AMS68_003723 [Peltaster fructicola]
MTWCEQLDVNLIKVLLSERHAEQSEVAKSTAQYGTQTSKINSGPEPPRPKRTRISVRPTRKQLAQLNAHAEAALNNWNLLQALRRGRDRAHVQAALEYHDRRERQALKQRLRAQGQQYHLGFAQIMGQAQLDSKAHILGQRQAHESAMFPTKRRQSWHTAVDRNKFKAEAKIHAQATRAALLARRDATRQTVGGPLPPFQPSGPEIELIPTGPDPSEVHTRGNMTPREYLPAGDEEMYLRTYKQEVEGPRLTEDQEYRFIWSKGQLLGRGGMGAAFGYVLLNLDDNPVDFIVLKESRLSPGSWNDITQWVGDVRDVRQRKHVEVAAMEKLVQAGSTTYCARIRNSLMSADTRVVRIVMDYCHHGELGRFISMYQDGPHETIPEPVIWAVTHALATACHAMASGCETQGQYREDWVEIVHRDIKPGNIFLTRNTTNLFQGFPLPVLGDFGLAIFTHQDDSLNPDAYLGPGTPGWRPPEMMWWQNGDDLRHWTVGRLQEATNIWAVGRLLIEMMNPFHGNDEYMYQQGLTDYNAPNVARNSYSAQLNKLVGDCLKVTPLERLSATELLDRVEEYTGLGQNGQPDLARGMRTNANTIQQQWPDPLLDQWSRAHI